MARGSRAGICAWDGETHSAFDLLMKIVVILNFARSGGTLLTRMLGMLPNVVMASEINSAFGVTPDNRIAPSADALRQQMDAWYGISLEGENLVEVASELAVQCKRRNQQLVIRDWSYLDFRKCRENGWAPSRQFTLLQELEKVATLNTVAMVRDAIDVCLSNAEAVEDFAEDYLAYVEALIRLGAPIMKYENLVRDPDATMRELCELTGLQFSTAYRKFSENQKCTGDSQLGGRSRGGNIDKPVALPRRWIRTSGRADIERCEALTRANRLLGYPVGYDNGRIESLTSMLRRRFWSSRVTSSLLRISKKW